MMETYAGIIKSRQTDRKFQKEIPNIDGMEKWW